MQCLGAPLGAIRPGCGLRSRSGTALKPPVVARGQGMRPGRGGVLQTVALRATGGTSRGRPLRGKRGNSRVVEYEDEVEEEEDAPEKRSVLDSLFDTIWAKPKGNRATQKAPQGRARVPSPSTYESWEAEDVDPDEVGAAAAIEAKPKRSFNGTTFKEYLQFVFQGIDSTGTWALVSTGAAMLVFGLATVTEEKFLVMDMDMSPQNVMILGQSVNTQRLLDAEITLNLVFFWEYVLRLWSADEKVKYASSPQGAAELVSFFPIFLAFMAVEPNLVRYVR
mmetsp:Transcript_47711/g.152945  ORF Transcript_47711/g.152945 Transcript_47711/m.152945 type:complete len:279 (+) Transcript_47711:340-1176(+)